MTTTPADARATALYNLGLGREHQAFLMPATVNDVQGFRWQDATGRPLATEKAVFDEVEDALIAARRNRRFRGVLRLGVGRAA